MTPDSVTDTAALIDRISQWSEGRMAQCQDSTERAWVGLTIAEIIALIGAPDA